jgi:cystathionine beta-lyase
MALSGILQTMSDSHLEFFTLAELATHRSEKWRAFPSDVIPLPVAEMDFPVAEPIKKLLHSMVENSDLGYLGPIPELGTAFASFSKTRWSWVVDPTKVRVATDVGVGVVEVIRVFAQPGDSVLISSPIYQNFYTWINETKVRYVDVPFIYNSTTDISTSWSIDWEGIEKAYQSGIKVHLLCSPHNPIGRMYTRAELERFVELARVNDVIIISDEIHSPLEYKEHPFTPILTLGEVAAECCVVVTAASKGWSIAGLKCAIILSGSERMHERLHSLPPALHSRASIFGAFATAIAFSEGATWLDTAIKQLDSNRHLVATLIKEHLPEVIYTPPQHSYLAWLDLSALNLGDSPGATILEKSKVALNSGHIYGAQWNQFARLNFATSPEIITTAITQIGRTIHG